MGWQRFSAEQATFHCCMPFTGLELPTDAPSTTEAAVTDAPAADTTATEVTDAPAADTTTEVTDAPVETDASGNMPSATAQPDGCVSWDYAPAGFENEVSYCVSGGMVFLMVTAPVS